MMKESGTLNSPGMPIMSNRLGDTNEETEKKQTLIDKDDLSKEGTKKQIFVQTVIENTEKFEEVEEKEVLPKQIAIDSEDKKTENVTIGVETKQSRLEFKQVPQIDNTDL